MLEVLFSTGVTIAVEQSVLELTQKDLHNEEECRIQYSDVAEVVEDNAHMMCVFSKEENPNNSESEDMAVLASSSDDSLLFTL